MMRLGHAPTVLIVEGEPLARISLGELFRDEGWQSHEAGSFDEAVHGIDANPMIDALLIDLYLPSCHPLLAYARLRLPAALIVTMGSFDTEIEQIEAQWLGAHEHFDKPLSFSDLHGRIAALLMERKVTTAR